MASGAVRPNLRLPAGEADPAQWDPTLLGPLGGDCAATCGL